MVTLCRFHHRLVHEAGYTVDSDPAGGLQFRRPDGTPVPHQPPPAGGETERLVAANVADGLAITADTLIPDWDGSDPDYSMAVGVLQNLAQPA